MKLNKQQRRRIAAQQADKLAEGDASQSATVVCHLGYQLILEQYGALLTADWRKHSGDIACNDRVL
ncbi:MAG: ribosome biogenesis GTPase RsgA, partial [Cardiobacterium sp.]